MAREPSTPTFASRRDRIAYLAGEHKLLVASIVIAVGIIVAFSGGVSIPPWIFAFMTAYLLIGVPAYVVGHAAAKRYDPHSYERVWHTNAYTDERELYFIESDWWAEHKRNDGPPPRRVNDGRDLEVRDIEIMDDIDAVRVEGARLDATMDSKLATSATYVEDIHDHLEDAYAKYSDVRERVSQMGMDVKRDTVNTLTEALERGVHPGDSSIADAWERAESDVDDMVDEEIPGLTHDHVEEDLNRWEKATTGAETPGESTGEHGAGSREGGEL